MSSKTNKGLENSENSIAKIVNGKMVTQKPTAENDKETTTSNIYHNGKKQRHI